MASLTNGCFFSTASDKENLDRSSDSSASGFDSPAGKLVSYYDDIVNDDLDTAC